jgi:hypothetical protein
MSTRITPPPQLFATVEKHPYRTAPLPATEPTIDMNKEVEDYKSIVLTGMSKEEWEEVQRLIRKYLHENKIETDADQAAFEQFVKSLLKRYGFKGDMDEVMADVVDSAGNAPLKSENETVKQPQSNHPEYNKNAPIQSRKETLKSQQTEYPEGMESQVEIKTEADGSRTMQITTANGQTFKIKLADTETDKSDETVQLKNQIKAEPNLKYIENAMNAYEKQEIFEDVAI